MNVNRENQTLNGNWTLSWAQNKTFLEDNFKPDSIAAITKRGYQTAAAAVPGNFELDLFRAGLIPDPFFGENTLLMQQFEYTHMFYYRTFMFEGCTKNVKLCFEGVDTIADIYLNGELVKTTENMFIEHCFPCPSLRAGENELVVHIKPAMLEARKYPLPAGCFTLPYNYESLYVRKATHMYAWDIMPRLLSGGIWRDVYLCREPEQRIDEVFAYTVDINGDQSAARLVFQYNLTMTEDDLSNCCIEVNGRCGKHAFSKKTRLWHTSGKLQVDVSEPLLWFPRGYGDPNLYETELRLYSGDTLLDKWNGNVGIRVVGLERTSTIDTDGNGEFQFYVNRKKIFVMGTNWVPADAFHSRDAERIPEIMPMLDDLNCNTVRCWGGNVYEHDYFFDYCDSHGILVWQDFAMACALVPQEQAFFDMIRTEVISVVKRLRNHASLLLWSGDNECDASACWEGLRRDPNENAVTRKIIPECLNAHDFTRPYLPSSPFIDEEAFETGAPISEDHLWGPRDYFKGDYYQNTVAHFASETGYHGCPSAESVRKFISPEHLWSYKDNPEWQVHAASPEVGEGMYVYRIELMAKQVEALFTEMPDNLEDFAIASQISQAEAKKYFIERFRIAKWRKSGIIWWNLIDGWPQFSDAVVDYYFDKKLAYHYIKKSQQQFCMMFDEPQDGKIALYAVNDLQYNVNVDYKITELSGDELVHEGTAEVSANESVPVFYNPVLSDEQRFYKIEWAYKIACGQTQNGENHFMTGLKDVDLKWYVETAKKGGFWPKKQ